jgi:hypothetical protein
MQLQFGCIGERLAASSMYWRAACSQSHFHAAMHLYLEMLMARFFVLEASHRTKLWKFLFFLIEATNWGFALSWPSQKCELDSCASLQGLSQ